jgi:hypothetical protein
LLHYLHSFGQDYQRGKTLLWSLHVGTFWKFLFMLPPKDQRLPCEVKGHRAIRNLSAGHLQTIEEALQVRGRSAGDQSGFIEDNKKTLREVGPP